MIKLADDTIDKTDISLLVNWLSSEETPRLTKGDLTKEFETLWSQKFDRKYSVFVNSGSSAILLGLYSLVEGGYLKNNKVVTSSLGWITDVSSILHAGLEPILCDCNLHDLSIDLVSLETIFKKENPSVLLLVSVLGLVPNMDAVLKLCEKYDVLLAEDVAESAGSKFNGKKLGTFGIFSIFSLYYGHHLSTIEGGMLTTDDFKFYELALSLRSHGWGRDLSHETQQSLRNEWNISEFNSLYTFYYPGFNFRATDLQAFIGLNQIKKLDSFCEIRHQNYLLYTKLIQKNMLLLNEGENHTSNFAYPMISKNKDNIVSALLKNDIEARPLIAGSIGRSPFWIKKYGVPISFPNCDLVNSYGFYIPNHQNLSTANVHMICDIINSVGD